MFESFSKAAESVVNFAREEAVRTERAQIGTEDLLVGILRSPGKAAGALQSYGVSLSAVRYARDGMNLPGDEPKGDREFDAAVERFSFTPRAQRVVDLAILEAHRAEQELVEPEYILLALLTESAGLGIRILEILNVNLHALEASLRGRLFIRLTESQFKKARRLSDAVKYSILLRPRGIIGKSEENVLDMLGEPDFQSEDSLVYRVTYEGGGGVIFKVIIHEGTAIRYEITGD